MRDNSQEFNPLFLFHISSRLSSPEKENLRVLVRGLCTNYQDNDSHWIELVNLLKEQEQNSNFDFISELQDFPRNLSILWDNKNLLGKDINKFPEFINHLWNLDHENRKNLELVISMLYRNQVNRCIAEDDKCLNHYRALIEIFSEQSKS